MEEETDVISTCLCGPVCDEQFRMWISEGDPDDASFENFRSNIHCSKLEF